MKLQRQLLKDYEEDITKYAKETDKAKILAVYSHISTFLAKENKKYQITKIAKGARNREYIGAVEWLKEAGVINVCYCLSNVELPLKGNYKCFASLAMNNFISTGTTIPLWRWIFLFVMPIH